MRRERRAQRLCQMVRAQRSDPTQGEFCRQAALQGQRVGKVEMEEYKASRQVQELVRGGKGRICESRLAVVGSWCRKKSSLQDSEWLKNDLRRSRAGSRCTQAGGGEGRKMVKNREDGRLAYEGLEERRTTGKNGRDEEYDEVNEEERKREREESIADWTGMGQWEMGEGADGERATGLQARTGRSGFASLSRYVPVRFSLWEQQEASYRRLLEVRTPCLVWASSRRRGTGSKRDLSGGGTARFRGREKSSGRGTGAKPKGA
ncbi:hypothetical protein CDD82_6654 [Ophiocordyceps australis]|uniref:Uncharacterized protein n=1 Tax=Ophiocordyceps australis TaxID=1399860 RepID=A0A2C5ZJS0_9HYPO|nr:hypothetical protein CDD82_6654 [Ophiocordyceps australis]